MILILYSLWNELLRVQTLTKFIQCIFFPHQASIYQSISNFTIDFFFFFPLWKALWTIFRTSRNAGSPQRPVSIKAGSAALTPLAAHTAATCVGFTFSSEQPEGHQHFWWPLEGKHQPTAFNVFISCATSHSWAVRKEDSRGAASHPSPFRLHS